MTLFAPQQLNNSQLIKAILVLVAITGLLGCNNDHDPLAGQENYLYRLSNALDTEIDSSLTLATLPLYPSVKDNSHTIPSLSQGVIEVFQLGYCDQVLNLIAYRNSSLGKVMLPSQRLKYELTFFNEIEACYLKINQDANAEDELVDAIREIYRAKAKYLPAVAWNGTFSGQELDEQFARTDAILPYPLNTGTETELPDLPDTRRLAEAFVSLERIAKHSVQRSDRALTLLSDSSTRLDVDGNHTVHSSISQAELEQLEDQLHKIFQQPLINQIHNSLALMTQTMNRASAALTFRTFDQPLCVPGRHSKQKPILNTVFARYYLGEFQPYLALVHKTSTQLLMPLAEIYKTLPQPSGFRDFGSSRISMEHTASLWLSYVDARDKHTKAWQGILRACDLRKI